jgi:hypothetical protein
MPHLLKPGVRSRDGTHGTFFRKNAVMEGIIGRVDYLVPVQPVRLYPVDAAFYVFD